MTQMACAVSDFETIRKAAEQGQADAQTNLGVMYYNGEGVVKNAQEAVKWWLKAAEQGNAEAQYYLGLMYDNGVGLVKNFQEAVKWYRKAAEQGQADSQFSLGLMYVTGEGVVKNFTTAYAWFLLAKFNGYEKADEGIKLLESENINANEGQKLAQKCLDSNYKDCS